MVKNPPAGAGDTGDVGSIPGSGRSPRGGDDNPLQYSCQENPKDIGAWQATVHGVTKNWTQLKRLSMYTRKYLWRASQVALVIKNPPANAGDIRPELDPWVRKIS